MPILDFNKTSGIKFSGLSKKPQNPQKLKLSKISGYAVLVFITWLHHIAMYRIAQNFGGKKLWRIWYFTTDPPKFYPPIIFILAILLCKAVNPPMFCPPKCLSAPIRQSFLPPKFCAIRYIVMYCLS